VPQYIEFLRHLYSLFNARDIDGVLARLHPEVVWANGMEGGYVHGHDGLQDYWTRQWAMIDPHVEPLAFSTSGTRTAVEVRQTVHDHNGVLLADKIVSHLFEITDGLVTRFDIS
jgi:hypothetical protein